MTSSRKMAPFHAMAFVLLGTTYLLRAEPTPDLHEIAVANSVDGPTDGKEDLTKRSEKTHFTNDSPRNVTAVSGHSALLLCSVKNLLKPSQVSWIRKRDLHILTSMSFTYTSDGRFTVVHPEASEDWHLRIDYVQPRDAGIYECQVNTEPKIHLAVSLNVLGEFKVSVKLGVPKRFKDYTIPPYETRAEIRVRERHVAAKIQGPEEVYVKKGSTISLTCTVDAQDVPHSNVTWYHAGSVIDFDSPRGGVSLETEKTKSGTTSKLLVTRASLSDSGNYTCVSSKAAPATVIVHVLNGEHPAAMQHGGTVGETPRICLTFLLLLLTEAFSHWATLGFL